MASVSSTRTWPVVVAGGLKRVRCRSSPEGLTASDTSYLPCGGIGAAAVSGSTAWPVAPRLAILATGSLVRFRERHPFELTLQVVPGRDGALHGIGLAPITAMPASIQRERRMPRAESFAR